MTNLKSGSLIVLFTTLIILFATGCSTPVEVLREQQKPQTDPGFFSPSGDYKIGIEDQVQVSVWKNPELGVSVPVRPDGKISVPLIGDVKVGGHTSEEVAKKIEMELSKFIRDPQVTVILTALRSHEYLTRIRVTGAVVTPRSLPYRQGITVLDAVLEAGGVNDFAAPDSTKIYRKVDSKTLVMNVYLQDILMKGKLETNYLLKPGDVITIPERLF